MFCSNAVNPLPPLDPMNGTGLSMNPYPDNGYSGVCSRGRIAWIDPDAMPYCAANPGWKENGMVHPLYADYHVEIYQDGKLVFDEPHWKIHSFFADNTNVSIQGGDFHYFFPISTGHVYSGRVGKNGNDGTTVWSAPVTFSTAAVAAVVPTTVQTTAGQRTKKK